MNPSNYSKNRLIRYFGDLETAEKRGYTITDSRDIFISYTDIQGIPTTYTPKYIRDSIQKTEKNRKYGSMGDGAEYLQALEDSQIYGRTRKATGNTRYLAPKKEETNGLFVSFRPTLETIQAFNTGANISTLLLTEGEFKADLLSTYGAHACSFSGISTFNLTADLKALILKCGIDTLTLCYDGDLYDLSQDPFKEGKNVNDRPLDFYRSAFKFASKLFEWLQEINEGKPKEQQRKIKLLLCHPYEQEHKAADDMILSDRSKSDNIIRSLKEGKNSRFFTFHKLSKSTFKAKLSKLFNLDSVSNFYKAHKEILQNKPFKFSHDGVSCSYRFCNLRKTIITETRPFFIDLKAVKHFHSNKYIGKTKKQRKELFNLLDSNKKTLLSFPTGTGKTTLSQKFAHHFIDQDSTQLGTVYIVAPLVRLGLQIAKDIKKVFIYNKRKDFTGKVDAKKNKYDKRIVICTYDCIKNGKILVNENDLLIVDEAHDLVNQFHFRSEAIRDLYNAFDKVKKVICLSATPNMNFLQNEGFKLVTGTTDNQTKLNYITHILDQKTSVKQAIIKELLNTDLAENLQIDGTDLFNSSLQKKVHVVFINNKSDLQDIQNYLLDTGIVQADEIALLTSERQETDSTFIDIVDSNQIGQKIRIVLTTCLLSEGINIKNKNVGKILIGGIKCIDMLVQFPARFRKMLALDVHLFWKQQNQINTGYFIPTTKATEHLFIRAKAHRQILQNEVNEAKQNGFKFEPIKYHSENFNLAYIGEDGTAKIDRLKVYATEKERYINTVPLTNLIAELARLSNVTITDSNNLEVEESTDLADKLKTIGATRKEVKQERKERILQDIEKFGYVALTGLQDFAKQQKKTDLVKEIQKVTNLTPEEKEQLSNNIEKYKSDNSDLLNCDTYIKILQQYCKLLEHTPTPTQLIKTVDSQAQFKVLRKSLEWLKWMEIYKDRNKRQRTLTVTQIADTKAHIKIQKDLTAHFQGREKIALFEIYGFISSKYDVRYVDKKGNIQTAKSNLSENRIKTLFFALFEADKLTPDTYTNIKPKTYENTLKVTQIKVSKKSRKNDVKR